MTETLKKFTIPPDQNGYGFNDPTEILMTQLEGGASKFRRDILNSNFRLNVQWSLDREGYKYFRIFYNTLITRGADFFLLDLYVDDSEVLTEHRCHFIPGTTGLKSQSGTQFVVGGTIEVCPMQRSLENNSDALNYQYNTDEIAIFNAYGYFGETSETLMDRIDVLINTEIPADF